MDDEERRELWERIAANERRLNQAAGVIAGLCGLLAIREMAAGTASPILYVPVGIGLAVFIAYWLR